MSETEARSKALVRLRHIREASAAAAEMFEGQQKQDFVDALADYDLLLNELGEPESPGFEVWLVAHETNGSSFVRGTTWSFVIGLDDFQEIVGSSNGTLYLTRDAALEGARKVADEVRKFRELLVPGAKPRSEKVEL